MFVRLSREAGPRFGCPVELEIRRRDGLPGPYSHSYPAPRSRQQVPRLRSARSDRRLRLSIGPSQAVESLSALECADGVGMLSQSPAVIEIARVPLLSSPTYLEGTGPRLTSLSLPSASACSVSPIHAVPPGAAEPSPAPPAGDFAPSGATPRLRSPEGHETRIAKGSPSADASQAFL